MKDVDIHEDGTGTFDESKSPFDKPSPLLL